MSSTIPHSRLNKRHVTLSYHWVRECIAAGIVSYHFIDGDKNPADILSKHWGYQQVWPLLQPLLFWEGDTITLWQKIKAIGTSFLPQKEHTTIDLMA